MATATIDACQICANSFNFDFYKSVSLPCGHAFCLLCLVRLRASGKSKCPACRLNWAEFVVPPLPGMEALAIALQVDQEDEDSCKEKSSYDNCSKHSMPYDFWVNTEKEFYCKGCAAANPPVKLELIQNAIPQVKASLADEVPNAKKEVESQLLSLDKMHIEFVRQRNCVGQFMKAVETFNDALKQNIEQILAIKSEVLKTAADLNKLERKVDSIKSTADLHVVGECKATLKKVGVRFNLPILDHSQTLLCHTACTFVEEADTVNAPFKASLVNAVLKGSPEPLLEMVRASEKLRHGQNWTVDNNNCDAVRLALADKQMSKPTGETQILLPEVKQPKILTLIERGDGRKALPVAALAKAVISGVVEAKFMETFYSAKDTTTDAKRLQHFLANKSARLQMFYGHLDHSAIAKLPHTVTELGLAMGNAADAAAISGLSPWEGLGTIGVSVTSRIAVEDLKPLPNIYCKSLFFPFLTDANVDFVRPAIEALVPELRIMDISFPKCLLTATGPRHLAQNLRGVMVDYCVAIEATSTWRPDAREKTIIRNELRSCEAVEVRWDMDWFFCRDNIYGISNRHVITVSRRIGPVS